MLPVESPSSATPKEPLCLMGVSAEDACVPGVADCVPLVEESLPGSELLAWRRGVTRLGGDPGAFDWLLDVAAGVSPARLRALRLHPATLVPLNCSRRSIERLWHQHLAKAVPLQYLVGQCFWRDFALEVGPGVLIPRPETERMIDLAVDLWRQGGSQHPRGFVWADLGTGSGCLALGLARAFPDSHGLAVDLSPAALGQARRNLRKVGLHNRVRLIAGDWFDAVAPWWGELPLVLANPPYIPSEAVNQLDPVVRDHEPRLALDGGGDGLACIRRLVAQAPRALAPGGWLLLEHHHDQSPAVITLFAHHGLLDVQAHSDLEGQRRFVCGRLSPAAQGLASRRRP
jgi:release factor glutamine methyltransferase